ncbi:MAG TPA: hypothetical protein VFQ44_23470 [Streptosporangiaceae bacterium]|nr:hypothetical protein [Streptosporangiaceae bacterium]
MDLVRTDFALIPGNPLFDAAASQAITDEFCYVHEVPSSEKHRLGEPLEFNDSI